MTSTISLAKRVGARSWANQRSNKHDGCAGRAEVELGSGPRSGTPHRITVLSALDVDTFVATLLAFHPSQQRTVLKALKARYDHSSLKDELARGLPWAQAVRQKLIATAAMLPPFGRERIEVLLAHTLDTVPDLRVSTAPALPPPAASPPSV